MNLTFPRLAPWIAVSVVGALALAACPSVAKIEADTRSSDTVDGDTATVDDTSVADTAVADTGPGDTGEADTAVGDTTAECTTACDCPQGRNCISGTCAVGAPAVFCCSNTECPADLACVYADGASGLCGVDTSPLFGAVVINEILTDGETDGDPNGDGDFPDPVGDEFVELVNVSAAAVDLGGLKLVETTLPAFPRHTFPASTSLAVGEAYVIFGGGTAPDDTAGATFAVANAQDPGTPFGLSLDNSGDTLQLVDADGKLVARFTWGADAAYEALGDESYSRSPDLTGDFVPHSQATSNASAIFSPGTRADGTAF